MHLNYIYIKLTSLILCDRAIVNGLAGFDSKLVQANHFFLQWTQCNGQHIESPGLNGDPLCLWLNFLDLTPLVYRWLALTMHHGV